MTFSLTLRTPVGVVFSGAVDAVRAEDLSGWFGIWPSREDLVAVLPPGLLLLRDRTGEGFLAHSGGLLSLTRGDCRVTAREAVFSRSLDEVAGKLAELEATRGQRDQARRDVMHQLAREALRRLVREVRS